jgi:hypothetical protein
MRGKIHGEYKNPTDNSGVKPYSGKFPFILLTGTLLLASALISCSHPAQHHRRNPEPIETETAGQIIFRMKARLGLTDEQEVNIRPIIEKQVKKRKELIRKYKGRARSGMDSLEDELKDLRISTESRLQYFLSNEQMIEYGNMQQEEDQIIVGRSSEKTQEGAGQEKPKGRGRRSRGSGSE